LYFEKIYGLEVKGCNKIVLHPPKTTIKRSVLDRKNILSNILYLNKETLGETILNLLFENFVLLNMNFSKIISTYC